MFKVAASFQQSVMLEERFGYGIMDILALSCPVSWKQPPEIVDGSHVIVGGNQRSAFPSSLSDME